MNRFLHFLIILTLISNIACKKNEMISSSANSPLIQLHGRTVEDQSGQIQLISSASYLKFRFIGNDCRIWLKNVAPPDGYNYVSVVLDGIRQTRTPVKSDTFYPFIIKPSTNGPYHDVEFYKETEAGCGFIVIKSIDADSLQPLPALQKKKIEFIGNSITVGMSSDPSLVPCESGAWFDQHDAYDAYGPRIARMLDLDYMVNGVSGIGIYRNWNTEAPIIGDVYEKTYMSADPRDPLWDFNRFVPDMVSINLGTNDLSPGDGVTPRLPFDSLRFINTYVSFIQTIHDHYPEARFLLLNSAVINHEEDKILIACLKTIKQKAESSIPQLKPVSLFSFNLFEGSGCSGHPGVKDHERMANELAPFIKKLL
jgi:hypothetical protein